MAEGEGFEPSRTLRSYRFSRAAHSTGLCDPSTDNLTRFLFSGKRAESVRQSEDEFISSNSMRKTVGCPHGLILPSLPNELPAGLVQPVDAIAPQDLASSLVRSGPK